MRILSSFSDYYDAVMKQGMDRDVVYVRDIKSLDLDKKYKLDRFHSVLGSECSVHMFFLGYCGQVFKIYSLRWSSKNYIFFDYESFKEFMLTNGLGSKWDFNFRKWWSGCYQRFFEHKTDAFLEIFHEYQTPLFLIKSSSKGAILELNPKLKDVSFQRIKDPYTAYQDIFQYVSGVLNSRENYMVKITDKDKIAKHGFDKHSFRKLPGGKKRRK